MVAPRSKIADVITRYCDVLIVSSDFSALNARERLEHLGTAAARLWQPIEALACTPDELAHAEPATLLEEIVWTGIDVA